MSRVAKNPVDIPKGVEAKITDSQLLVKGGKGNLNLQLHRSVGVTQDGTQLKIAPKDGSKTANALAGTFRALIHNMMVGVSKGFVKKLELQGVGYRAKAQGKTVSLTLGYSHPIEYQLPDGVSAETPSVTEIILAGADKQLVGQVAAELRDFRRPEPYKGKGIRYVNERVYRKEAKKK